MYQAASSSRVKLPLKPYKASNPEPSIGYITFSYAGDPRGGIRVLEMLHQHSAVKIAQGNDIAVKGVPYAKLKLYLTWPGYSSAATFVMVDCYNVSRANLAAAVSRHVAAFVEKCSSLPVSSSGIQWRLGHGAIAMKNIVITNLLNTGGDIWQPEIEIEP